MATTFTPSAAVLALMAEASLNAEVDALDVGAGTAGIQCYEGALLVVTFALPNPAYGAASAANPSVAALNGTPIAAVAAASTVGAGMSTCVFVDRDGTTRGTGSVGLTGSSSLVEVDNVIVAAGQTITLTACPLTLTAT